MIQYREKKTTYLFELWSLVLWSQKNHMEIMLSNLPSVSGSQMDKEELED